MSEGIKARWLLLRLATDPRISATLPELRQHTILDILDLHEVLDLRDLAAGGE